MIDGWFVLYLGYILGVSFQREGVGGGLFRVSFLPPYHIRARFFFFFPLAFSASVCYTGIYPIRRNLVA